MLAHLFFPVRAVEATRHMQGYPRGRWLLEWLLKCIFEANGYSKNTATCSTGATAQI